ncbi:MULTISPECIES: ATP-binding protein [Sphingomonas]|uniref:histidine kinase n=1 Tax=Sphingomonas kyungheensis TaxID=1069987 RepID=A0ABU8GZ37_9SPHN|nr:MULTISPECIES: ATP-binding protein [unclassified Sphingomonas]EZP54639.1 Two-component, sensor histidine protein kinase [Sphingomonas sp. RIT328]
MSTQPPRLPPPAPEDAAARNMRLLVLLRWMAVGGQLAAILIVRYGLGIDLPVVAMGVVLAALVMLNVMTWLGHPHWPVTNFQLFGSLACDVAALSAQLYLSGGPANPFISLYFLQVVMGAVLLHAWSSWVLVGLASVALGLVAWLSPPLALPPWFASHLSPVYIVGLWANFVLAAVLLVLFVTRIAANLRSRDAHLATMRQRAAEQDQIVRMGLLASGAAHELGTPLASILVLLGDWRSEPAIRGDARLAAEVDEMQAEVLRCKTIVSGILFAAGEVTGEAPERTTLRRFLSGLVAVWPGRVTYDDRLGEDRAIVADKALGQALTNVFDNAAEAGAGEITLTAAIDAATIVLTVRDDGGGFSPAVLAGIGRPYNTSKDRRGAGLGLFLATNVLRTLGGTLTARNVAGGAELVLRLPVAALALEEEAR